MEFKDIVNANAAIKTTAIRNKEYAEVNQRVKAFRMVCPNGTISTEMVTNADGLCIFKATILDDNGNILGTGHAYEREGSTNINRTSYIENCETSAIGRALGMCGFGIDVSIASFEEVTNAIENQNRINKENRERVEKFIAARDGDDLKGIIDFIKKHYNADCVELMNDDACASFIATMKKSGKEI